MITSIDATSTATPAIVFPDFAQEAATYEAVGIAPFPLGKDTGKKPLVRSPKDWRPNTWRQSVDRFPYANVGFWCGQPSRIFVVDVDSTDPAELRWALDTFGPTPVIVQTGSGKFHAYYRHNGERHRIRPKGNPSDILTQHSIDLLANGVCVAPPSIRPDGGVYHFIEGGPEDFASLPAIRPGVLQTLIPHHASLRLAETANAKADVAHSEDFRNVSLFNDGRDIAAIVDTNQELLARLLEMNTERFAAPLDPGEVREIATSIWKYKLKGELWLSGAGQRLVIATNDIRPLLDTGSASALMLYTYLRSIHFSRPVFAASPEAMEKARILGRWGERKYRSALRALCLAGLIERIKQGGKRKGDCALYRFAQPGLASVSSADSPPTLVDSELSPCHA